MKDSYTVPEADSHPCFGWGSKEASKAFICRQLTTPDGNPEQQGWMAVKQEISTELVGAPIINLFEWLLAIRLRRSVYLYTAPEWTGWVNITGGL